MTTELRDHRKPPSHSEDGRLDVKPFPIGCLLFLVVFFALLGLAMGEAMVNG